MWTRRCVWRRARRTAGDTLKIAVLAALNIADECFRSADDDAQERRDRLSDRAGELERMLDIALGFDQPSAYAKASVDKASRGPAARTSQEFRTQKPLRILDLLSPVTNLSRLRQRCYKISSGFEFPALRVMVRRLV